MTTDYPIVIVPLSDEDGGGFLGFAPDLPGCMSDGSSQQEALQNTLDAIDAWIEAQNEMGRELPEPGSSALRAEERDLKLREAISVLAEDNDTMERDISKLKARLAGLIKVLEDKDDYRGLRLDVPRSLTPSKPHKTH